MKDPLGLSGISPVDIRHELDVRYVHSVIGLITSVDIRHESADKITPIFISRGGPRISTEVMEIIYNKYNSTTKVFVTDNEHRIESNHEDLVWDIPPTGYYNIFNKNFPYCVFVYKNHAKQFKRGITQHNHTVINPWKREVYFLKMLPTWKNDGTYWEFAYAMFNNSYIPFQKAYNKLMKAEALSLAVNKNYALGINLRFNKVCLYRDYMHIGFVDDGGIFIPSVYEDFKEELQAISNNIPIQLL